MVKGRGGRGGGGQGQGSGGRQGRKGGGGPGRPGRGGGSGGGFVGRAAGQQQQQQQQQQQEPQPVQLRLFFLTQHLVLQCFNPLDDLSRKHAFEVMGWPRDNYLRRQQVLREQVENAKKEKRKQEEEEKQQQQQQQPEDGPPVATDNEGELKEETEGETSNNGVEGLNDVKDGSPDATEAGADDEYQGGVSGVEEKTKVGTQNETEVGDSDEPSPEEATVLDDDEVVEDAATKNDEQAEVNDVDDKTEDETEEELQIDDNENPLLLPLLSAPIDPQTLLDRLNTRRLYARLLYYKREQKRKVEEEAAKALSGDNAEGETNGGPEAGVPGMGGPIQKMYRDLLKEKVTMDRVWRKNMTIEELANLEWNELLKVAELRNAKKYIPYDPIPTQHELLLFSPCPRAVGVLASYPRSGNSLMRTLYEHTTLRVTGSDMQGGLAKHDLVGEMAVGTNMVQFVKTHFPERQGTPAFRASRVVLLVRNPFDAIESFFNLMITGEHTKSISAEARQKAGKYFEEYALKEIRVWKLFHQFWMKMDVPILLIRYEDIVRFPDKVMERVVPFVLEVKRMGSFFSERIDRCIRDQQEIERLGSYKPRSGGIGKAVAKYSPELFEKIMNDEELRGVMKHLHYQELLEKPPEEWSTLTPLENYAIEYLPSWAGTDQKKVVLLNNGNLARTKNEETRWRKIKMEMGLINEKCMCAECVAERAERAAMEQEGSEEKKSSEETESGDGAEENEGEGNDEDEELDEDEEETEGEDEELIEKDDDAEAEEKTGDDERVEEEEEVSERCEVDKVEFDKEKTGEEPKTSSDEGNSKLVEEDKVIEKRGSVDTEDEEFQAFLNELKYLSS